MIELPTPETDSLFWRNGYPVEVDSSKAMQLCEKLEQERDWITEKFKLLEGCFKRAERERDDALEHSENEIGKLIVRLNKSIFRRKEAERERDEAFALLASEKITRNHIIKRSVEVERERDEARELAQELLDALSKLVALNAKMTSDDCTYERAYYCYYKGHYDKWKLATEALAKAKEVLHE